MPLYFAPPRSYEQTDDFFYGRYRTPAGQTVLLRDGSYVTVPYPWMGELADLVAGTGYFLGGHTYTITETLADALEADGYTVLVTGFGGATEDGGTSHFGEGGMGDTAPIPLYM